MEKRRILAVDDNAVNLAAVEQALASEFEIVPVLSGQRALKFLERRGADLVLLDIQMPEMDGRETLVKLREMENGANIPVIFLTALSNQAITEDDAKNGVVDYITKPFDREDLMRRVAAALE